MAKRAQRRKKGKAINSVPATPLVGPLNVFQAGSIKMAVSSNLLRNLIDRDVRRVQKSFDRHFGSTLAPIDEFFSEAATLFVMSTGVGIDRGLAEDYKRVLAGLSYNALSTVGAATILLRSGMKQQSMVLVRQAVEMCSTIIHIVGDESKRSLRAFEEGNYHSTASIGQAKKVVPILGVFWGFLSKSFVHINRLHGRVERLEPYAAEDEAVKAIMVSLRMAVWICYLAIEMAFPTTRTPNRYWKLTEIDGRDAIQYDPDEGAAGMGCGVLERTGNRRR